MAFAGTKLQLKLVFRYDPVWPKFRVCRLLWTRGLVGFGGYSAMLSLSFRPLLWLLRYGANDEWRAVFLGMELHYLRSYGGIVC